MKKNAVKHTEITLLLYLCLCGILFCGILFPTTATAQQEQEIDFNQTPWGMSSQEVIARIPGEVVGTAVLINSTFKGHPVVFECRFRENRLFALNAYPRQKKTAGDHYQDFLVIITQLSKQYGVPTLDNKQNIGQATWITKNTRSRITLTFQKTSWVLLVREQKKE